MSKFTASFLIVGIVVGALQCCFLRTATAQPPPRLQPKLSPGNSAEVEEMQNWEKACVRFTDGFPKTACNPDMATLDEQSKKSGKYSLKMQGSRTLQHTYTITLPIRGGTKYKVSVWIKIENRACYNYLNLNYPSFYTATTPGITSIVQSTKGIWCGAYRLEVHEPGAPLFSLLQPVSLVLPLISYSNVDWFNEESYLQTSKGATSIKLSITLQGFDGKIWIDGLTLAEVDSVIDDKALHIPITHEFQGMRIKQVSESPLFIETNAAKFTFSDDKIEFHKDGELVSTLAFKEPGFLQNLQIKKEAGIIILENANIILSAGADSTLLTKLRNDASIVVAGKRPTYKNFEAGIIFATDYSRGVLFSPIYSPQTLRTMPFSRNTNTVDFSYNDADFEKLGLKNWQVLADFSQNLWQIRYDFKRGDGFITSIFPPKDFDEGRYCQERENAAPPASLDLNMDPQLNPSYFIQKFAEHYNIMILESGAFAVSVNDKSPPTQYYLKDGRPVSPATPGATAVPFTPFDHAGPVAVKEERALRNLVNQAHQQGIRVVIYVTPTNFYTTNVDIFLENLRRIIDQFSLDGAYFDGLMLHSPLKSLELVRKARNFLKGKYLILHHSWQSALIRRSDHFRTPFYDAYGDRVWLGEGMKKTDEDTWRLNYAGQNVSNTVSILLPELRPVNYALIAVENKKLSLPPQQQIDRQLAYKGEFRLSSFFDYKSFIGDTRLPAASITFDPRYYWNKLDNACLAKTCGNNICDVGETMYTCPRDCAPEAKGAALSRDNGTYTCSTNSSVAQWVVDGKPFYQLHFTFDDRMARDDSDNKMNPHQGTGWSKLLNKPPEPGQIDSRKTFYFDGSASLSGRYDETLDFTDKNFSVFSVIKRDNANSTLQVIFALAQDLYYGIRDSKLVVFLVDNSGTRKTFSGMSTIDQDWHTIGIVYERPKLKLYVDGKKENEIDILPAQFRPFGIYSIGALSPSDKKYNFRGYLDDLFVKNEALTEKQIMQYHLTLHKTITLSGDARCIITDNARRYSATTAGKNGR